MEEKFILQAEPMNLRIQDFILDNYAKIIDQAKHKYAFISYQDALELSSGRSLIWRHDIDFSVPQAVKMAEIENRKKIASTYFVQLSSKFYNIFEHETMDAIFHIMDFGHDIGLHFDPSLYPISTLKEFEERLCFEKQILEQLFHREIKVFSLHMPTTFLSQLEALEYAGMINTYASFFKINYQYCSDSNGYWRFDPLDKVIAGGGKYLHVLTHPVWWTEEVLSPLDRLKLCIDQRAWDCEQWYLNVLKEYNRKG